MKSPLDTILGTSKSHMQKLGGYRIMELDSGKSTENEYWDWALSAGHYSFGLAQTAPDLALTPTNPAALP